MPNTDSPKNFGVKNPIRTRAETTSEPLLRPRRIRYFKRADAWFNRCVRMAAVMHEGFWLGYLGVDELNAVTTGHYESSVESASPEHNLRGFFDWELAAVKRYFPHGSRVLVVAGGGGREVLALRRAGYSAEGFECNPALVEASKSLFEKLGEPGGMTLSPADQVPSTSLRYDGVIVGWTAYSHMPTRERRLRFLRGLRQQLRPGSPVLLSFFTRIRNSRYDVFLHRMASVSRFLLRGRREPLELGDHLNWSFSHWFTREEIEAELRTAGIRPVHFGEVGDGHAVGIVESVDQLP